jgi:hypothetical protein
MLASLSDVNSYLVTTQAYPLASDLLKAERWVAERVHGLWPQDFPPLAVREAAALLAAIFVCDPLAAEDESRVPNMVRLMILPYC